MVDIAEEFLPEPSDGGQVEGDTEKKVSKQRLSLSDKLQGRIDRNPSG